MSVHLLELLQKSVLSVSKDISSEFIDVEERVDHIEILHRLSSYLNTQKLQIGLTQAEYVQTDHDLWIFCYQFAKEKGMLEEAYNHIKRASDLLWGQGIVLSLIHI